MVPQAGLLKLPEGSSNMHMVAAAAAAAVVAFRASTKFQPQESQPNNASISQRVGGHLESQLELPERLNVGPAHVYSPPTVPVTPRS